MPARMRRACSRPACWTVQRFLGWRSTTESLPCGGRSGTTCCDQRSSAVSDGDGRALPSYDDLLQERSEEHTSELQSLMRISYAVFCLKKKKQKVVTTKHTRYKILKQEENRKTQ